jgi:hypothetical protein
MGMAQAMATLAGEIRSATTARNEFLTNFRQESKRWMNDIHHEHQEMARGLREKLSSEEKGRQNTAQQDAEQRRVTVSELCSNTHNLLKRFQIEHKEMAGALREKLSSEEKARIEAARQMMNDTHRAVNDIRRTTKSMLGEITADLRGAHEAWGKSKKKH